MGPLGPLLHIFLKFENALKGISIVLTVISFCFHRIIIIIVINRGLRKWVVEGRTWHCSLGTYLLFEIFLMGDLTCMLWVDDFVNVFPFGKCH